MENSDRNNLIESDLPNNILPSYDNLKNLSKSLQTFDMVYNAVKQFNCVNHDNVILKYVSKKLLTREICELAVSKNGRNLQYVPFELRDEKMCMTAVENDGACLGFVPITLLDYEMCLKAVKTDSKGEALESVPDYLLQGEKGKFLCKSAVEANHLAICAVPKKLIDKELAKLAIEKAVAIKNAENENGADRYDIDISLIIDRLPITVWTAELVWTCVDAFPQVMRWLPVSKISKKLCFNIVRKDALNLQFVPEKLCDDKLIDMALEKDPMALMYVPEDKLTKKRVVDALKRNPKIPVKSMPEDIVKFLESKKPELGFLQYNIEKIDGSKDEQSGLALSNNDQNTQVYDFTTSDNPCEVVHYISDLHLEHQLNLGGKPFCEVQRLIEEKINELIGSVQEPPTTLLIGGDVADSAELETIFYKTLKKSLGFYGKVIAVLGNHELWDSYHGNSGSRRSVDDIINSYIDNDIEDVFLLENELLIMYMGLIAKKFSETEILDMDNDRLRQLCEKSTLIVLGGIGFSGLNTEFNAKNGLYRDSVTFKEDRARSKRFGVLYDKISESIGDMPVIVLTHNNMSDWSNKKYNPKWIYVSGHTHRNNCIVLEDGTRVLNDNQVGYTPKTWHLNSFMLDKKIYDPFEQYTDGIYKITRDEYINFNLGRNIRMQGMKYPGTIYAIKRDNVYMFLLENNGKYNLLAGGQRRKLDHDIKYYYEKLPMYVQAVKKAFEPYNDALNKLAYEVKCFGGFGRKHGCIVDIDFCNHIYLNPYDGKIIPYYALDIVNKLVFNDIESLLKNSPAPPRLPNGQAIFDRFKLLSGNGKLPLTANSEGNNLIQQAVIPEVVFDTSIYRPSAAMKAVQYVLDANVVRIWKDEIISNNGCSAIDLIG